MTSALVSCQYFLVVLNLQQTRQAAAKAHKLFHLLWQKLKCGKKYPFATVKNVCDFIWICLCDLNSLWQCLPLSFFQSYKL